MSAVQVRLLALFQRSYPLERKINALILGVDFLRNPATNQTDVLGFEAPALLDAETKE